MPFSVKCRLLKNAVESYIVETRPVIVTLLATLFFVMGVLLCLAGPLALLLMLTPFKSLMGIFLLTIALVILFGLGLTFLLFAWGLYIGSLLIWCAIVILNPVTICSSSVGLLNLSIEAGFYPFLGLGLLVWLEWILVITSIRPWIFMSSRLRWKVRDLEKIAATPGGMAFADKEASRLLAELWPTRYDLKPDVVFLD